ncbi:catenin alpha-2-like, partial [Acipenser ruthenus]|uniref:catenin alpha-2-like n=1 Tax=Acipenser ruthenus TaxID=7906 RepID=UPI002740FE55
ALSWWTQPAHLRLGVAVGSVITTNAASLGWGVVWNGRGAQGVEEALEAVKNATNEQDLANRFKEFGKEMVKLNYVAARRQQELKDPQCRDEMAAARGALKKNATMLYTASQAFLRHPDVAATRANRDYVFKQVQEAIAGISNAAQASSPTDEKHGHAGIGELAAALNEFDVSGNVYLLTPVFIVNEAKWWFRQSTHF